MLLLGFGLAVASSLALNAGYLLQHLGGASAPAVDVRAPVATVRGLLRSRLWVLGIGTNLFGSVLHIGALAVAPLALVQAFSAAGLALAAGVLYGASDAATKGFTDAAGHGLFAAVLTPWPAVIVALCGAAFFALQRGLQLGAAATVIVLLTAATNVIAVAAGVAVFSESFGTVPGIALLHLGAMVAIAGASWRLAAVQARIADQPIAPRRRAARRVAGALEPAS